MNGLVFRYILGFVVLFFFPLGGYARVIQIDQIEEILSEITPNTLVLFDMDDTLTDSTISLGSSAWRKYLREYATLHPEIEEKLKVNLHDVLTWVVAQKIPVQPVENRSILLIRELQERGLPALCFTARGKTQWYATEIPEIDALTHRQLRSIDIHFENTSLPKWLLNHIDPQLIDEGVIFSSPYKKGIFLKKMFSQASDLPSKIVFVDDKKDQVDSLEDPCRQMGISYVGFWYVRAEKNHQDFDPWIATIQLEKLLLEDKVISDQEALLLKEKMPSQDVGDHLKQLLEEIQWTNLLIQSDSRKF